MAVGLGAAVVELGGVGVGAVGLDAVCGGDYGDLYMLDFGVSCVFVILVRIFSFFLSCLGVGCFFFPVWGVRGRIGTERN